MAHPNFLSPKKTAPSSRTTLALLLVGTVAAGAVMLRVTHQPLRATISDSLSSTPTPIPNEYLGNPKLPELVTENSVSAFTQGSASDTIRYQQAHTTKFFEIDLHTRHITPIAYKNPDGVLSPDGSQIAFIKTEGDNSTIFIGAPDGTAQRKILDTRATDLKLSWPAQNIIALSSQGANRSGQDLTLIGMDGTLDPLLRNMKNLEYTWSRNGSRLLYSFFSQNTGITLWYMDIADRTPHPLGVSTSARKCAWDSTGSTLACGIPSNTPLSQDVPAAKSATLDDIVTIRIAAGIPHTIYTARSGVYLGVIDPIISSSGSLLVFANLFDQKLYMFPLR